MKVVHVLETSAPELVGYTVRGRYIVNHQRRLGLGSGRGDIAVFPRCGDAAANR